MRSNREPWPHLDKYLAREYLRLIEAWEYERESTAEQATPDHYGRIQQGRDVTKRITKFNWLPLKPERQFFDASSGTERERRDGLAALVADVKAYCATTGQAALVHVARVDRISRDDEDGWGILNELVAAGVIVYFAYEDIACGLDEDWRGAVRPRIAEAARLPETHSKNIKDAVISRRAETNDAISGGVPTWGFELDPQNGRLRPQHALDCPNRPRFDTDGRALNAADPWNLTCPTRSQHAPVAQCTVDGVHLCALSSDGDEELFCPIRGRLLVLELYRTGEYTEQQLALRMCTLGWRTPTRRRRRSGEEVAYEPITRGKVRAALVNPIVIGKYERGFNTRKRSLGAAQFAASASSQPTEPILDYIRAVYDVKRWDEIQALKGRRTATDHPARVRHAHVFRDLVHCARCTLKFEVRCQDPEGTSPHYTLLHPWNAGCRAGKREMVRLPERRLMDIVLEHARRLVVTKENIARAERYLDAKTARVRALYRSEEVIIADIKLQQEIRQDRGYDYPGGRDAYKRQVHMLLTELTTARAARASTPTRASAARLGTLAQELAGAYEKARNPQLAKEERDEIRVALRALLKDLFEDVLVDPQEGGGRPVVTELRLNRAYEALWIICGYTPKAATRTSGSNGVRPNPVVAKIRGQDEVRAWLRRQRAAA